jgi:hypothetical protein
MSASVLIEAVEAEGFGEGGVVVAAFGDVQAAQGIQQEASLLASARALRDCRTARSAATRSG